MALRTVLYDWHVAHGARMVDFAGWDMPVQYSTIALEHQAVRQSVGLFDISHMGRLSFGGAGALDLIQHIYTNNAATMKDSQVRYGLVCNDEGGIRDDVLVYRWPFGYAMVVNASNREKIVAWLADSRGDRDVRIMNQDAGNRDTIIAWMSAARGERDVRIVDQTLDTCMVAVQGPGAIALCQGLVDANPADLAYYYAQPTRYQGKGCVISRTGYTGEDGVELMVGTTQGVALWEELVRRGAKPCGLGARDTLRLEAAMPLYGHELNEEIDPLQAGLGWAVKLDKGDFRGKAALLRRKEDKTRRQRVGLELAGKRMAREGAAVKAAGQVVGSVTSGTFSPTLQKTIAMAMLDPRHTAVGTVLSVDVRGKDETAAVTALPFYKRKS